MAAEEDLIERCEFIHVHEDIVAKVTENMPDEETLYDLADLFRLFADSTRIKILYVLFESEMCVCDIAQLLGMTQSAISHQLRSLKQAKLVKRKIKIFFTPQKGPPLHRGGPLKYRADQFIKSANLLSST